MIRQQVESPSARRTITIATRLLLALQLDGPLLIGLGLIASFGLIVLYSASGQDAGKMVRAVLHLCLGTAAMLGLAQVRPQVLRRVAPWLYGAGVFLLVVVFVEGEIGKGAQRWLDLGFIRFQPSEILKIAVPMACAWYLHERPLPPSARSLGVLGAIILVPAALIIKQPDLGTALLIMAAGTMVIIMAGLPIWIMLAGLCAGSGAAWFSWVHLLHDYQRERVLTFIDPQNDPLGSGYHIIQSQIAIGSGGVFGKGWMNGSQAQLDYLPERHTDFIFAVIGEEFGMLGQMLLVLLYLFVVARALYLTSQMQDTFARLLAASLALTFFVYVFINTGMVSGLLPVVGVPLPLVSYGGTSMVTLLAGFGILMSLYSHRKLVGT